MSSPRTRAASRPRRTPDFGLRAASYDELRPPIPGLEEALVREGDLSGRRVLDVGSGTGRLAAGLAERHAARVWGIDAEPEMVRVAKARGSRARFRVAPAESLPFKDGWFERATMVLAAHLVDRPRAFRELHRILAARGLATVATFEPGCFARYYLCELFPSIRALDEARFPKPDALERELREAGFASTRVASHVPAPSRLTREEALRRIRGRHISTFDLLDDDEFARGLERAERELPAEIEYRYELVLVTAER
jgi:SAM-dependent methyltransferase